MKAGFLRGTEDRKAAQLIYKVLFAVDLFLFPLFSRACFPSQSHGPRVTQSYGVNMEQTTERCLAEGSGKP